MRRVLMTTILLLPIFFAGPAAAAGPDPKGIWLRGDGNARVRIASCGENICATNVWIKDTSGGEEVGDKLVMAVKPKSDGVLVGKAFDPKRGLSYSMEITVRKDSLATRGCIIGGLLCKAISWSRVR